MLIVDIPVIIDMLEYVCVCAYGCDYRYDYRHAQISLCVCVLIRYDYLYAPIGLCVFLCLYSSARVGVDARGSACLKKPSKGVCVCCCIHTRHTHAHTPHTLNLTPRMLPKSRA